MSLFNQILTLLAFILATSTFFAWDSYRHQKLLNEELIAFRKGKCELVQGNTTIIYEDCRITPEMAYINTY